MTASTVAAVDDDADAVIAGAAVAAAVVAVATRPPRSVDSTKLGSWRYSHPVSVNAVAGPCERLDSVADDA